MNIIYVLKYFKFFISLTESFNISIRERVALPVPLLLSEEGPNHCIL